jgi:hypothetical protein
MNSKIYWDLHEQSFIDEIVNELIECLKNPEGKIDEMDKKDEQV